MIHQGDCVPLLIPYERHGCSMPSASPMLYLSQWVFSDSTPYMQNAAIGIHHSRASLVLMSSPRSSSIPRRISARMQFLTAREMLTDGDLRSREHESFRGSLQVCKSRPIAISLCQRYTTLHIAWCATSRNRSPCHLD